MIATCPKLSQVNVLSCKASAELIEAERLYTKGNDYLGNHHMDNYVLLLAKRTKLVAELQALGIQA